MASRAHAHQRYDPFFCKHTHTHTHTRKAHTHTPKPPNTNSRGSKIRSPSSTPSTPTTTDGSTRGPQTAAPPPRRRAAGRTEAALAALSAARRLHASLAHLHCPSAPSAICIKPYTPRSLNKFENCINSKQVARSAEKATKGPCRSPERGCLHDSLRPAGSFPLFPMSSLDMSKTQ